MGCVETGFDIATTAGFYSQAAGVLAGFAFAAVLLILTRGEDSIDHEIASHSLATFVCAFFGLLWSTIEYAVMAGASAPSSDEFLGRAAISALVVGTGFALSILLLIYGVLQLLGSSGQFPQAKQASTFMVSTAGPIIMILFLSAGIQDVASAQYLATSSCDTTILAAWSTGCAILGLAIVLGKGIMFRAVSPQWLIRRRDLLPIGVLYLVVASTVGLVPVQTVMRENDTPPDAITVLVFAVGVVASSIFAVLSAANARWGDSAAEVHDSAADPA
jgi:hypothetical protein